MASPEDRDDQESIAFLESLQRYAEASAANTPQESEAAALQAFATAAEKMAREPTEDFLLVMEVERAVAARDWPRALELRRQLVLRAEALGQPAIQEHLELSALFFLLGDTNTAWEGAMEAARRAASLDLDPGVRGLLQAMALNQAGVYALEANRGEEALQAIQTALSFVGPEKIHDLLRAQCYLTRARALALLNEDGGSAADLEVARSLLEPMAGMATAAGVHGGLARYCGILGQLRAQAGDVHGAVEAWEAAVARRRHVAGLPQVAGPAVQDALGLALRSYAEALQSAGRIAEAQAAFQEVQDIRAAFGLPARGQPTN